MTILNIRNQEISGQAWYGWNFATPTLAQIHRFLLKNQNVLKLVRGGVHKCSKNPGGGAGVKMLIQKISEIFPHILILTTSLPMYDTLEQQKETEQLCRIL